LKFVTIAVQDYIVSFNPDSIMIVTVHDDVVIENVGVPVSDYWGIQRRYGTVRMYIDILMERYGC
jgi:hypothetical protein